MKATCVSGFEQSQVVRKEGKLREARVELLKCVQLECARLVREQCVQWLEEVERATPSITLQATADGEDIPDVRIDMDDKLITTSANGMSFDVDPGVHKFLFTNPNFPPVEKTIVLREGEKLRPVLITFQRPRPAPGTAPPKVVPPPPPPPVKMVRPIPALTYAFTGLAVAGGGAFAFFAISGDSRKKQLERDCSPECLDSEVEPVETYMLLANVSLGVGAAGVAGAIISYLARPSRPAASASVRTNVAVTPQAVGASVAVDF